jgi:hypothetical protein
MGDHGQISAEYVMIMGIGIVTTLLFAHASFEAIELNTLMSSARNGVTEGIAMDSMAVYPSETFKKYSESYPRLKTCSRLVYIETKCLNMGYDRSYQKTKLKIKIRASAPDQMTQYERNCLGDRINYYVRKNICKAFKTEDMTNVYYNPAFSDHYIITTSNVEWL